MLDVLEKIFFAGVIVGGIIGVTITIVITLILLEIEDKKEV